MELLNQMDGFDQNVNVKVGLHPCMIDYARSTRLCCSPLHALTRVMPCANIAGCLADQASNSGSKPAWRIPSCPASAADALWRLVQVIMATNRADTLDPALLRPGRLDRKIEFPMPDRRQKRLVFQVCSRNTHCWSWLRHGLVKAQLFHWVPGCALTGLLVTSARSTILGRR